MPSFLLALWMVLLSGCADITLSDGMEPVDGDIASDISPQGCAFPHAEGWSGEHHGNCAITFGASGCLECHPPEQTTSTAIPACTSCHDYPHQSNWKEGSVHSAGDLARCAQCHGEDGSGGKSGVSCRDCHTDYPHAANWKAWDEHGIAQKSACTNCHRDESLLAPECTSCHHDYPHREGWNDPSEHGTLAGTTCFDCHQIVTARESSPTPVCTSCHTDYPHDTSTHGARYLTERGTGTILCNNCHGASFGFSDLQTTLATLMQQSICYQCHQAYPHESYTTGATTANWRPASGGSLGHVFYLVRGPLLLDANGRRPNVARGNDPVPAVRETCGGDTGGQCHSGTRTGPVRAGSALCSGYCHRE